MKYLLLLLITALFTGPLSAQKPLTATNQSDPNSQSLKIDHIAICVMNLDSSTAFYERYFRMDTLPVPFKNVKVKWYRMSDGTQLHVVEGIKKPVELPPFSHFCIRVQDFDKLLVLLKADNVPVHNGLGEAGKITVRGDGVRQALIRDPSGYWLEISDAK